MTTNELELYFLIIPLGSWIIGLFIGYLLGVKSRGRK